MTKHFFILLLVAISVSCSNTDESIVDTPEIDREFEVIAHLNSDPDGLHPFNNISGNMAYIFESLHKRILRVDLESLELIPELASAMPKLLDTSSTAFQFSLNPTIKWDDGSPLTASDVRFTLMAAMCPLTNDPQNRATLQQIVKHIEVLNDEEFIYETNSPYAGANYIWNDLPIIQAAVYDPDGVVSTLTFDDLRNEDFEYSDEQKAWFEAFNSREYSHNPENINGLGQYQITHWEEGQNITLERKENWWGAESTSIYNQANPTKIHFKIISDETTVNTAITNGEVEVCNNLSSLQAKDLKDDELFQQMAEVKAIDIFGVTLIALNSQPEKFGRSLALADPQVRKAIILATPYDEVLDLIHNMGSRQASIVAPSRPYYDASLLIQTNAEEAGRLLDETGWIDTDNDGIRDKEGEKLTFEIGHIDNPGFLDMVEILKDYYLEIGIEATSVAVQPEAMFPKLLGRDYDAFLTSLTGDGGYEDLTQILHTSQRDNGGLNFTGFGNENSDAILDQINLEFDTDKRYKLYKDIQKEFCEQGTFVILYAVQRKLSISKKYKTPTLYSEKPSILLHTLELNPEQ